MNPVLFDLGIIEIRWYSMFILLGVCAAFFIITKEAKRKNIDKEYLYNLFFYTLLIGILGARLYYVLFNIDYYLANPSEILMIWHGGLAIHGGIIFGLLFIIFYSKRKKVDLLLILDIAVVGIILAQAIGRWGNFFNGEAYGRIVSLSFLKNLHLPDFIIKGMYINGKYREPTFLYESILSFIGFIILLIIRRNKNIKIGMLTSIYLIWYGIERLIIESFRSDSLMLMNIKVAQLVSIIFIISGIIIFIYSYKNNKLYNKIKK